MVGPMRKTLYVLLGFFALAALAAGALILMPVDSLRAPLEQAISRGIGRGIHIAGSMHVSFYPEIGVSAGDVSIDNVPGGEAREFAHVGTLAVGAKLLPLLSREIDITKLTLENPAIHLEVDANGNSNWNFQFSKSENTTSSTPSRLSISGLKVTNGEITYFDARTSRRKALSQANFTLSMAALDQPAVFSLDAIYEKDKLTVAGRVDSPDTYVRKLPTKVSLDLKSRLVNLHFDGSVTGTAENAGTFAMSGPSLREVMERGAGASAPTGHGLGVFSVSGNVSTRGRVYTLQGAKISLDGMKGQAELSVDTAGEVPALKGNIGLDRLDLAAYMTDKDETAKTSGWSTKPLSLSGLNRADADIDVSVDRLSVGTFTISRGRMHVGLSRGVLTADLARAGLFNGTATGRVVADARGAVPKFGVNLDVKSVAIQSLLQSLMKINRIEGTGAMALNVAGSGPTQQAIMNSLSGTGSVMARNGAIRGVDLAAVSRTIQNALSGSLAAATSERASTDFAEAGGTFKISNGVMHNQDFHLLNPFVRITGSGDINLGPRTLEFHIVPKLVATSQGQGGARNAGGIAVPFLVAGPWTKPSYKPDMKALGSTVVEQIKSGEGLGGLLGGVLGGKKSGTSTPNTNNGQQQPFDLKNLFGR